jgi:hypothetical protein
MPALLGRDFIGRVKLLVTGGDSWETSQLDIAIALNFNDVCLGFAVVLASDAFQGKTKQHLNWL